MIHIKFTKYTAREVKKMHCPTCKSEQEFLCEFEEYYGWDQTCMNCGDAWQDGELRPRPFRPAWRKEAIERARKRAEHLIPLDVNKIIGEEQ